MSQNEQLWYVGVSGQQEGPWTTADVVARLQSGALTAEAYVFTAGMAQWMPIRSTAPFAQLLGGGGPPVPPPTAPAPAGSDVIDFRILGEELQCVELTLDPGEAVISEAGAMLYMEAGIEMEAIFGDGTGRPDETLADRAMAIGSRYLTGESLALTRFVNKDPSNRRHVVFAAPYPGRIVPLDLKELGGKILCEKGAFLAAARGTRVGLEFNANLGTGLLGGEGFILQKVEGDGMAFLHAGGFIFPKQLAAGETIRLDTGCLVAMQPTIRYDVKWVGGVINAVFAGEGVVLATLTGPGTVWVQSLPFSRMAGKIYAAAPQTGGPRIGEGSVAGRLGDLAMGSSGASAQIDPMQLASHIGRFLRRG